MNYDENGGNSTTSNAFEQGIEAAKTKMSNKASQLGNAASAALTASGHPVLGKGAKMLGNNMAKNNANSESSSEGEEGSDLANNAVEKGASTAAKAAGVPAPLANAAGKAASNLANGQGAAEAQKKIKRLKLFLKLSPFIGYFFIILVAVMLIVVAINYVDQALDAVADGTESVKNLLALDGFNTNMETISKNIDRAANDCSDCLVKGSINNNRGLDKGLLISTVNNAVVVTSSAYDEQSDSDDTDYPEATVTEEGRIYIPSEVRQTGITTNYTQYPYINWGYTQRRIFNLWDAKGRNSDRGIATIDGRYLVAVSTTFGYPGDYIDVVLTNGEVIKCIIADAKSSRDSNYTLYGHALASGGGAIDVIEWEGVGTAKDIDLTGWKFVPVDYIQLYADNTVFNTTSTVTPASSSSSTPKDGASYILLDNLNTRTFYQMKMEMLGSADDPGTMIYSLMGEEISVSCVEDASASKNASAMRKYILNGLLTGVDIGISSPGRWWSEVVNFGSNIYSFGKQDSNYFVYEGREAIFARLDDSISSAVKEDITKTLDEIKDCTTQHVLDANGQWKRDANGNYVMKEPQLETVKINDYKQYYNYIAKVYTPTMYDSIWNTLSREEKIKLVNNVWEDIVAARNDYYGFQGATSYLSYTFDDEGQVDVVVTGSTYGSGSYSIGTVPTSEAAKAALSWQQGRNSPWSGDYLWSSPINKCGTSGQLPCTMGYVGCYITSLAKVMAISGTQINSSTFDPGVLNATLAQHGGYSAYANFTGTGWQTLVPNWQYPGYIYLDGRNVSNNVGTGISDYIKSTVSSKGYVGKGYYYIIRINHPGGGSHFIAVVGENEVGQLLLSDPAVNLETYPIDDLGRYYRNNTLVGMSVWYASDVAGGQ